MYFHTNSGSLMFLMGSFYPSRAFNPPETGGQPADFQLGVMHYPPPGPLRGGAHRRLRRFRDLRRRAIGSPAIATTVILNVILLWNEFVYAVVLITDGDKRTLPLGIQKFLGDQQQDVGMIATGLMIAIVPVVIVYVFSSEKLIRGMTAGAVK